MVAGLRFRVRGFKSRVSVLGFGVWGMGFRVWGIGFSTSPLFLASAVAPSPVVGMRFGVYRGTSLIRNTHPPWDHHRALDTHLL